ncbi:unnamed protein product [Boreogadus saida]
MNSSSVWALKNNSNEHLEQQQRLEQQTHAWAWSNAWASTRLEHAWSTQQTPGPEQQHNAWAWSSNNAGPGAHAWAWSNAWSSKTPGATPGQQHAWAWSSNNAWLEQRLEQQHAWACSNRLEPKSNNAWAAIAWSAITPGLEHAWSSNNAWSRQQRGWAWSNACSSQPRLERQQRLAWSTPGAANNSLECSSSGWVLRHNAWQHTLRLEQQQSGWSVHTAGAEPKWSSMTN